MEQIVSEKGLIQGLSSRYAVKKFDASKKIPAPVWNALEDALVLSPSSFGLQVWKFLVITDAGVREKLQPASWNQPQITTCSHLVVLCHKTDVGQKDIDAHLSNISKIRSVDISTLKEYGEMMAGFLANSPKDQSESWATRQTYLALGNLLTSATLLGIDTCPMEGFDAGQYNQILGLNDKGLAASVVCACGYRAADDGYQHAKKVRFDKNTMIEHI